MKLKSVTRILFVVFLLLMVSAVFAEESQEKLQVRVVFNEVPQMLKKNSNYTLDGRVFSNLPITSVALTIFDEAGLQSEYEKSVSFNTPVYEYELEKIIAPYAFYQLQSGEKTLTLCVYSLWNKKRHGIIEVCTPRQTVLSDTASSDTSIVTTNMFLFTASNHPVS